MSDASITQEFDKGFKAGIRAAKEQQENGEMIGGIVTLLVVGLFLAAGIIYAQINAIPIHGML